MARTPAMVRAIEAALAAVCWRVAGLLRSNSAECWHSCWRTCSVRTAKLGSLTMLSRGNSSTRSLTFETSVPWKRASGSAKRLAMWLVTS